MHSPRILAPLVNLLRLPLWRMMAINLAAGIAVAMLAVGGLLLTNPYGLRELIFADVAGAVALVILLISFIISFGSWVMGSAIMQIGRER